jgi:putative tricarboxylic transport membrane protein
MVLKGSRAVGLGMALLGLAALALASRLREGTATGGPGTRFLPVLVAVIVVVLGAALALRSSASEGATEPIEPGGARRAIWTLGAVLAYVLAFGRLGFVLATAPFLAVLLLAYGERRWPVVLAVALGATGVTYALFAVWLGVPLPPGPLGR